MPSTGQSSAWSQLHVSLREGSSRVTLAAEGSRTETPTGRFLLWLFTAGRGVVTLLDRQIPFAGETGVLIPAGVKVTAAVDSARAAELIVVPFDCWLRGDPVRDARPYVDSDRLTLTLPGHVELSLHARMATLNLGQLILRARAGKVPADLGDLEAVIQLLRVLYAFRRSIESPTRGFVEKPLIRRAYNYLLENRRRSDLKLADIARHVGLSVTHLARRFRAEFGASPMRVLARERMSHARHLLAAQDFQVAEVARECGYRSTQYFCRVFKAEHGATPGEYRRRLSHV